MELNRKFEWVEKVANGKRMFQVKTAGIIGGIAPASTIEYYRLIIAGYRQQVSDGGYPSIIINSINLKKMLDLVSTNRLEEMIGFLSEELVKLHRAGADFAAFASNTPHLVFDELRRRSPLPLISIVEAARDSAVQRGLKRVGLFGTRFTMQGGFYPDIFSQAGITVLTPAPEEQDYIHDKYMNELANTVFLPETRLGLLAIAERLKTQEGIESLILGGTELPLILKEDDDQVVPYLDTTMIHVEQIVSQLLA